MEDPLRPPAEPERAAFALIETLGFRPGIGFPRRARHLARMARSAAAFGLPFDAAAAAACLDAIAGPTALRVRLTLDAAGRIATTTAPLPPAPPVWRVAIAQERLCSTDPWLGHKTTRRGVYDRARAALPPGLDEAILCNEAGALCEGGITTLFLRRGGLFVTPPLSAGLLPGILREELLEAGAAVEAPLTPADLARGDLFMGNSLRGLIPARLG